MTTCQDINNIKTIQSELVQLVDRLHNLFPPSEQPSSDHAVAKIMQAYSHLNILKSDLDI